MRTIACILILFFFVSCAKHQESESSVEIVRNEADSTAFNEPELTKTMESDIISKAENVEINTDFMRQHLEETINLIVLQNQMQLDEKLARELESAIAEKVEKHQVNPQLNAVKISDLEMHDLTETNAGNQVTVSFTATSAGEKLYPGTATALIQSSVINIDGENYTDYSLFFTEIQIP